MTDDGNKLLHHRTEFDNWRSLTIGIYMALVGYAVMVGLPVISKQPGILRGRSRSGGRC
jgi:hypothetical protein